MQAEIRKIVIVGGGTAGWITAGMIAAEHGHNSTLSITLIESPDVSPIGVGEGTWPSMRDTLKKIGISEAELFNCCDASFKQASKFINWEVKPGNSDAENSFYYHPFSLPNFNNNYVKQFIIQNASHSNKNNFARSVCYQSILCESNLAPKQITTPEYEFIANYGYHLDASKFSFLLQKHCTAKLKVKHVLAHVQKVNSHESGDISSVSTDACGEVEGDLFIDCTGTQSLLLGKHYNVPYISKKSVLFNDCALAIQVPYKDENASIASCTLSTAQTAGWIWDIGLQSRRGVGYVYSSAHTTDELAEIELRKYIAQTHNMSKVNDISVRKLSFNPGYHEKFWHRNCVAVGMSAGFIEPLEASALVMIEQAAKMITEQLPVTRKCMEITANRFNQKMITHWQQIIDFLKLHYVLSKRADLPYWIDNRENTTIPDSLNDMLTLWHHQMPSPYDIPQSEPLFPAASYQYVLYGMNFDSYGPISQINENDTKLFAKVASDIKMKRQQLSSVLPMNRELINKINKYGLSKI